MKIELATINSPYLPIVKKLGRNSANTLGFFPEGAFDEHAKKKLILVALDENNNCLGYLLYRVSKGRASIVHLCIDGNHRKNGAARALVERLKTDTKDLLGISLRCRLDYEAINIWGKFGFVPITELKGRGKNPKILVYWWLNHGYRTLLDINPEAELNERLLVVADANVFFDFNSSAREGFIESNSLRADWLTEAIEICIVGETYNEILRCPDKKIREDSREFAGQLTLLIYEHDKVEETKKELIQLFFENKILTKNDESDIIQLAQTICSNANYFVTRDDDLLKISEEIFIQYGIRIKRPSDLIILLDELRRENEYQPAKLSGTSIQISPVKSAQGESLNILFQNFGRGESKNDFQLKLRRFLSNPVSFYCFQVIDESNCILALIIYDKSDSQSLKIPMFRVKNHVLSSTLIRNLILKAINDSYKEGKLSTRIEDQRVNNETNIAALEFGFLNSHDILVKFHLYDVLSAKDLTLKVKSLPYQNLIEENFLSDISQLLSQNNFFVDAETTSNIEKSLYPVKITDSNLPSFIIPIQPQWAMELFDENLAAQFLYGAKKDLALRKEQVFYRSPKNSNGLRSPARILWYVSQGQNSSFLGTGAIKACSFLDDVLIDKPKVLFSMFKRLGIYSWKEIDKLVGNDINKPIMVLRFSNTQLFKTAVDYSQMKSIANENGNKIQVMSPCPVSSKTFIDIYKEGLIDAT